MPSFSEPPRLNAAGETVAVGGVYQALLDAEEAKHERRGGRLLLVGDERVIRPDPSPRLRALRESRPVEVAEWEIPRQFRSGRVGGGRWTIHPDGRMTAAD